jgi:hypothetical protein
MSNKHLLDEDPRAGGTLALGAVGVFGLLFGWPDPLATFAAGMFCAWAISYFMTNGEQK